MPGINGVSAGHRFPLLFGEIVADLAKSVEDHSRILAQGTKKGDKKGVRNEWHGL
jgi:hypothetical protein